MSGKPRPWEPVFQSRIVIDEETGCHIWTGTRQRPNQGYGLLAISGGRKYVHRLAWEMRYGPIEDGLFVLHKCDNPPCCNPDHLFLGTCADNVHDMLAKKRGRGGPKIAAHGEAHYMSKLTDDQARSILNDDRKSSVIASEHGITRCTVREIKRRVTWKHLETENAV